MSSQKWEVVKEKNNWKWTNKTYEVEKNVEDIEDDARVGDVGCMVAVLAFVVFVDSVIAGLLFAGILRSFALRVNPSISRVWLGSEIELVFMLTAAFVTLAQVAIIIVHARLGRLIYNHTE